MLLCCASCPRCQPGSVAWHPVGRRRDGTQSGLPQAGCRHLHAFQNSTSAASEARTPHCPGPPAGVQPCRSSLPYTLASWSLFCCNSPRQIGEQTSLHAVTKERPTSRSAVRPAALLRGGKGAGWSGLCLEPCVGEGGKRQDDLANSFSLSGDTCGKILFRASCSAWPLSCPNGATCYVTLVSLSACNCPRPFSLQAMAQGTPLPPHVAAATARRGCFSSP